MRLVFCVLLLLSNSLFPVSKEEFQHLKTLLHVRHGIELLKQDDHFELFKMALQWEGVPYKMGERSRDGMGTSELVEEILDKVYSKSLTGTPSSIFRKMKIRKKWEIPNQGDLIFFKFENKISHVGVYLKEKRFIHSSAKKGVSIDSLEDPQFAEHFFAAGTFPECPE